MHPSKLANPLAEGNCSVAKGLFCFVVFFGIVGAGNASTRGYTSPHLGKADPRCRVTGMQLARMDSKCGLHKFLLRDTSRLHGLPAPRNMPLDCVHIFGHFVQMNDKMFNCAGLAVPALSVPSIPVCSVLLETRTQKEKWGLSWRSEPKMNPSNTFCPPAWKG